MLDGTGKNLFGAGTWDGNSIDRKDLGNTEFGNINPFTVLSKILSSFFEDYFSQFRIDR